MFECHQRQTILCKTTVNVAITTDFMNNPIVPPENEHLLLRSAPGSRGETNSGRRRTLVCRVCPRRLPDGSINYGRQTTYYCSKCQIGLHPDCFDTYHKLNHDNYAPKRRQSASSIASRGSGKAGSVLNDNIDNGDHSESESDEEQVASVSVNAVANPPVVRENEHLLLRSEPGSRGEANSGRRRTLVCRVCPRRLPDGSINYGRQTTYYCSECQVAFHPNCFGPFHELNHHNYAPLRRKSTALMGAPAVIGVAQEKGVKRKISNI